MLNYILSIVDDEDRPKIEKLFNDYNVDCFRLSKMLLQDNSDASFEAEDIVQETFLRISKYCKKVDYSKSPQEQKFYILRIARNLTLDRLSSSSKIKIESYDANQNYENEVSEKVFFEQIQIHEQYERVIEAIMNLPDSYSMILEMRYIDGWSPAKIAKALNISRNTVYTNLRRAKMMLADNLK